MSWVTLCPPVKDTFIKSSGIQKDYSSSSYLWCGHYVNLISTRILMSFDLSHLIGEYRVLAAYLIMYVNKTFFRDSVAAAITPYRITEDWNADTVNWSNQPNYSTNNTGFTTAVRGKGSAIWYISDLIREWIEYGKPNFGLLLKTPERVNFEAKSFYSGNEDICVWQRPRLVMSLEPNSSSISGNVRLAARCTNNLSEDIVTNYTSQFSNMHNTLQMKNCTFFVKNTGSDYDAIVQTQISPDGLDFICDNKPIIVEAGKLVTLVPYRLAQFTRLCYKSKEPGENTTLKIWYQCQI